LAKIGDEGAISQLLFVLLEWLVIFNKTKQLQVIETLKLTFGRMHYNRNATHNFPIQTSKPSTKLVTLKLLIFLLLQCCSGLLPQKKE